jgi:bacteriorhodopsin
MWAHATPLMLYALSMISDFSAAQVGQTIAVDIVMIVTVIPGELIPGAASFMLLMLRAL